MAMSARYRVIVPVGLRRRARARPGVQFVSTQILAPQSRVAHYTRSTSARCAAVARSALQPAGKYGVRDATDPSSDPATPSGRRYEDQLRYGPLPPSRERHHQHGHGRPTMCPGVLERMIITWNCENDRARRIEAVSRYSDRALLLWCFHAGVSRI